MPQYFAYMSDDIKKYFLKLDEWIDVLSIVSIVCHSMVSLIPPTDLHLSVYLAEISH